MTGRRHCFVSYFIVFLYQGESKICGLLRTRHGQCLRIDTAEIYYEITGNPNGESLVLLHGGFGNMTYFNSILESIPSNYKIIGIDLRGHGKSTIGDRELTYAQYQSDIEAIPDNLSMDAYSSFDFSDGGIVGYRLAASEDSKVDRLTTLGSAVASGKRKSFNRFSH